jgi:hypothetical protein
MVFESDHARRSGTRGFGHHTRAMLYRASDVLVDLILVDSGGGALAVLHGQVVRGTPPDPVAGARVRLGGRELMCDPYGQFAVTLDDGVDSAMLQVQLTDCDIACPLPQFAPAVT